MTARRSRTSSSQTSSCHSLVTVTEPSHSPLSQSGLSSWTDVMAKSRYGSDNPNYKGGVCSIGHDDELLDYPAYLESRKQKILSSHTVSSTGCWIWTGMVFTSNGRARIAIGSKTTLAARVAYLAFKRLPMNDLLVCHSCDDVLCVNPEHLWLGTNADNSRDMSEKGRTKLQDGVLNNQAKLNDSQVRLIRTRCENGELQKHVAKEFGVSACLVGLICKRKIWKHVK